MIRRELYSAAYKPSTIWLEITRRASTVFLRQYLTEVPLASTRSYLEHSSVSVNARRAILVSLDLGDAEARGVSCAPNHGLQRSATPRAEA